MTSDGRIMRTAGTGFSTQSKTKVAASVGEKKSKVTSTFG